MPLVATYQEPLGKWTDVGGYNLLGKLYEDPKRWSFLFQSYVQLTRLHIHLQKGEGASVKLIERSLQNNRYCFVESGHDSGDLQSSEYDVLCEYFDSFNENLDLGVDLIVYLRSSPEVVYQRMQQRARAEEAGVPLAYLQTLHTYYERWLMERKPCPPPAPVLVIDANSDLLSVTRCIGVHQRLILGQETFDGHIKGLENEQKENRDPLEDNLKNEKQKKFPNNTEKTDNSSSEIK
ncbi:Deoxynucleoside kinase domain [Trinorchestia longiramus]|nr:Deoxynucleoside kinase domain [Trinorchestia longiramus]